MNHEVESKLLALLSNRCHTPAELEDFLSQANQQINVVYDLPISPEEVAHLLESIPVVLRTPSNVAALWIDQIKDLFGEESQTHVRESGQTAQDQIATRSGTDTVSPSQPVSIAFETIETKLAGVTYDNRQAVIPTLRSDDLLTLRREPNNPYDTNAIAVLTQNNRSVGFIPGPLAARLAPMLDKTTQLPKAKVLRVTGGSNGQVYGVIIQIQIGEIKEGGFAENDNGIVQQPKQMVELEIDDLDGTVHQVQPRRENVQPVARSVSLTEEQKQVIEHPEGRHARVLAVAGSGKTTTMAHRLKYLIEQGHRSDSMLVLMFNRLAREQFETRLDRIGIPANNAPKVRTFHALAYNFITDLKKVGLLSPEFDMWIGDKEELVRINVHRAIDSLINEGKIESDQVDVDEALAAISLWKGSLIPPERAGYRGDPAMPLVYERFEAIRTQKLGLTFDDFVQIAVRFLETNSKMRQRWCNRLKFLIVDEYQDVNYGQQRLIELLAGDGPGGADVMVVGDDDQTIYEWRGARPEYIIREFKAKFGNKPIVDYKLTNSFRFGCQIAQAAYHVIDWNTNRVQKRLIAHSPKVEAIIHLVENSTDQPSEVDFALANNVVSLVKDQKVSPKGLIILGRTFTQTSSIQAALLAYAIPFKVVGQAPFFERNENRTLLDYIRLAAALDQQCHSETERQLLNIANTPNRYLTRIYLESAVRGGMQRRYPLRQILAILADPSESPFRSDSRKRAEELREFMERLNERMTTEPDIKAGELLRWMTQTLNYQQHFQNYFGKGEESSERRNSVDQFINYAERTALSPLAFVKHVEGLDSTLGMPDSQLVTITTVHRTKGLEYDYVFIPSLQEGYMPCLYASEISIYDTQGIVKEPDPSETIENERRLCYVAITRAKKAVYIGVNYPPEGGKQTQSSTQLPSRFLDEMELSVVRPLTSALYEAIVTGREYPELIALAQRHSNNHKLLSALQDSYLRHIPNDALRAAIQSIPKSDAERPFAYSHAYTTIIDTRQKQIQEESEEDGVWSHIHLTR